MRTDPALTIIITNQKGSYDWDEDRYVTYERSVGKNRKNGYLTRDTDGNNVGIVYMSDDKRSVRYGCAEIMFFRENEEKYGRWRLINIGGRLPFSTLEKILREKESYTLTTKSRNRQA